jgi:isopentenyl diphosphate isomerase/L-lactate dehydrogenase-like FMN-dependent dehydrogenase
MSEPVNVHDYEQAARAALDPDVFDYFAGGAGDEITLAENLEAFRRTFLRPRVLVDGSQCSMATSVLTTELAWPVMIAPLAYLRVARAEGELAVARAARETETLYCVSSLATTAPEHIAAELAGAAWWFQLYPYRDRGRTREIVARARAAGCLALVVTVDAPRLGRRERDLRNAFTLPQLELPCVPIPPGKERVTPADVNALFDERLDWNALEELSSIAELPVVVKGVLTGEDASLAPEYGAAALIVSNHGGRQLDGVPATLDVLTEVVEAAGVEVYLDGGIRRGADVVKALGLGARAVLVGRPIVWGLAVDGSAGVRGVLETLRSELELTLALSGCPDIRELSAAIVERQTTVSERRRG